MNDEHIFNKYNVKAIAFSFFILSLIVGCILVWLSIRNLSFPLDRDDPGSVASVFVLTLMQNQESKAKSLVNPEQWSQIDSWMDEHEKVKCSWSTLDSSLGYGVGSGLANENSQLMSYSYNVSLPCPDYANYYCISVEHMVLRKTEGGWQVIDLGKVEEFFGDFLDSDC